MLLAVVLLQLLVLLFLLLLVLRGRGGPVATPQDPRQLALPDQLTHLHARHEALDTTFRTGLADLRRDSNLEATVHRESNGRAFADLRTEVTGSVGRLGAELTAGLDRFRADLDRLRADSAEAAGALRTEVTGSIGTLGGNVKAELGGFKADNAEAAGKLRADVATQADAVERRLAAAAADAREVATGSRDALDRRLRELERNAAASAEKSRLEVSSGLTKLNEDNSRKLEEMRATVDEKLHATLQSRLTESFGQVTDQLNKVHAGLGEMSKLSEGVDGLSRIFTNVKTRGGFAEVQLGMLLKQMLAPGQFLENASIRATTGERVEYAVRFPSHAGERLLPIDAKFPREAWERLEAAYESNLPDSIAREGRAFEAAIRTEGERICSKYIHPPVTTPYGIMFLPTEGLYAEVIRREALMAEVQSKCHVTIAGPTTLAAILTSFQMGFHMLALQQKGDEVWKVLEKAKTEFGTFETLMSGMEKQVGTVQNTIQKLGVRARAINRTLRDVSDPGLDNPGADEPGLEDFSNVVPLLAAQGDG